MFDAWPSIALLALLLVLWVECRLLAARSTMAPRRFFFAFFLGCVGASVLALVLHRIGVGLTDAATEPYSVGPVVEEVVKAIPIVLLAYVFRDAKRLTIADLVLIGLAIGLGFEFIESNLRALARGSISDDLVDVTPFVAGWRGIASGAAYAVGHGVWTAFVALGAGIGVRLWPRRALAWLPCAVALAFVSLEHMAFNWDVAHLTDPANELPGWLDSLYGLTLHGRLDLLLLVVGLLVAASVEARRSWTTIGPQPELMLDGERERPLVLTEWLLVLRRMHDGRRAAAATLAYMRNRRAFALAMFEAASDPGDVKLGTYVGEAYENLIDERSRVTEAELAPPSGEPAPTSPVDLARSYAPALGFAVLFVLLFSISLESMPDGLRDTLYSAPVALALAVGGLLAALWRLRALRRGVRPDRTRETGEELATFHMRAMLTIACVGSGVLGVATWFFPKLLLGAAGDAANNASSLGQWTNNGGNPAAALGLAALATAPTKRPKEKPGPCDDFRKELERGARLLADKEKELADLRAEYAMYAPIVAMRQHLEVLRRLVQDGVFPPVFVPPPPSLPDWREARISVLPNFIANAERELPGYRKRQAERERALASCMQRSGAPSDGSSGSTAPSATPVSDPQPARPRQRGGAGAPARSGGGGGAGSRAVDQLIEAAPVAKRPVRPAPVSAAPAPAWSGGPPVVTVPTALGPLHLDPRGNKITPPVIDHLGRLLVAGRPMQPWPPAFVPRPLWEGGPPVYSVAVPQPNDDVQLVFVDANGNTIEPIPGTEIRAARPDFVLGPDGVYVPNQGVAPASPAAPAAAPPPPSPAQPPPNEMRVPRPPDAPTASPATPAPASTATTPAAPSSPVAPSTDPLTSGAPAVTPDPGPPVPPPPPTPTPATPASPGPASSAQASPTPSPPAAPSAPSPAASGPAPSAPPAAAAGLSPGAAQTIDRINQARQALDSAVRQPPAPPSIPHVGATEGGLIEGAEHVPASAEAAFRAAHEQAIDVAHDHYQEALDELRERVAHDPEFWSRMSPEEAAALQQQLSTPLPPKSLLHRMIGRAQPPQGS